MYLASEMIIQHSWHFFFLSIYLIEAHIFYSKLKLPKLLMLREVHEQFPFPEIARHPSEMLLKPVLI